MLDQAYPTLRTKRLQLRQIVASDADRTLEILGDADNMRWFGSDPLPDLNAAATLIDKMEAGRQESGTGIRWGLALRDEPSTLIGSCGLMGWRRDWASCVVGYELHPGAQGQGYMGEALTEVFEFGFEVMELNRIQADIHPKNRPSRRLVERLGFVEEGRKRQAGFWGGQHEDLLLYSLLRSDWKR